MLKLWNSFWLFIIILLIICATGCSSQSPMTSNIGDKQKYILEGVVTNTETDSSGGHFYYLTIKFFKTVENSHGKNMSNQHITDVYIRSKSQNLPNIGDKVRVVTDYESGPEIVYAPENLSSSGLYPYYNEISRDLLATNCDARRQDYIDLIALTEHNGSKQKTLLINLDTNKQQKVGVPIRVSGYNGYTDTVYLYVKPLIPEVRSDFPSEGARLDDFSKAVVNNDPDSFTKVKVDSDGYWEYTWTINNQVKKPGDLFDYKSYMLYAETEPFDSRHSMDDGNILAFTIASIDY